MNEMLSSIQYRSEKINWILRCFIYTVVYLLFTFGILVAIGVAVAIMQLLGGIELMFVQDMALSQFISVLLIYLITFLVIKIFEKSKILPRLGFEKGDILKKYAVGFLIGTVLMIVSAVPIMLFFTSKVGFANPIPWSGILLYFIFFIIQGAAEEIMVRGMIFPVIVKESRPITALILTSVAFGAMHLLNPSFSIIAFINITLAGLLFGYCVLYFDSLWQACALHSAWNFVQGVVLGFGVSGMQMPSLIVIETEGNELLTGGFFGVEGSIFSLIVLTASIICFHNLCVKKGINIFGKTKKEVVPNVIV